MIINIIIIIFFFFKIINQVCNCNFLIKLNSYQSTVFEKQESILNQLVVLDKLNFFTDRFIQSASDDVLFELCFFIENLFLLCENRLQNKFR